MKTQLSRLCIITCSGLYWSLGNLLDAFLSCFVFSGEDQILNNFLLSEMPSFKIGVLGSRITILK